MFKGAAILVVLCLALFVDAHAQVHRGHRARKLAVRDLPNRAFDDAEPTLIRRREEKERPSTEAVWSKETLNPPRQAAAAVSTSASSGSAASGVAATSSAATTSRRRKAASSGSASASPANARAAAAGGASSGSSGSPTSAQASKSSGSGSQTTPSPLASYHYDYDKIPYQVNPYQYLRGPQSGYNICNSTTQGDQSECQTLIVNSLQDFCLWGSPKANGFLGDTEAASVAYCVKDTHGARPIPPNTFTGVQFLRTEKYIQVTGKINIEGLGFAKNDSGGELDPHGADLLGNPLGGLVYSTGFVSGDNKTLVQANNWNNFIGGNTFCFKLCDPKSGDNPNYCNNVYDELGCSYNMPNSYRDNEFSECDSDLQDPVGVYTTNGQTSTWSQPSSLAATATLPYTPRIPSSSNCKTYKSEELFATSSSSSSGSSASGSGGSGSGSSGSGGSGSGGSGSGSSGSSSGSGSGSSAGTKTTGSSVLITSFIAFATTLVAMASLVMLI